MELNKKFVVRLGIYSKDTEAMIGRGICPPVFIAAIAKLPLSIDRGMDEEDVVYIVNGTLLSHQRG